MKVILKDKIVNIYSQTQPKQLISKREYFNIVKEDGTSVEKSTSTSTYFGTYGLEWRLEDIVNLLKFLGIEYKIEPCVERF